MKIKTAPSLLSADFKNLSQELTKCEQAGTDYIHFDVMDGVFVPNISFGSPVLKSVKNGTLLPFDVHLMITNPLKYVDDFADAGADIITFHYESDCDCDEVINAIHKKGKKAGLAIKPATPVSKILQYIEKVDMVLVMTVEPGFGGQSFMESTVEKIKELYRIAQDKNPDINIEVDGGINSETAKIAVDAGADILVAGSYLFGAEDMKKAVESLKG